MIYPLAVFAANRIKRLRSTSERREKNYLIKRVISSPRHIVVTRLQNIGDMVAFIPSLIKLRDLYPQAEIILMGKHIAGIETIKGAPFIDGIVKVGKGTLRDKIRLFRRLRQKRVDIFIISSQDQGRVPWALLSGARVIVAFDKVTRYNRESKEKLRPLISLSVSYKTSLSDAENNLRLIEALGCDVSHAVTRFDWIGQDERYSIDQELRRLRLNAKGPLVVFSPGTKRPSRAWPAENFRELAVRMNKEMSAKVVLVGAKKDRSVNEAVREENEFVVNLAGKTSVRGLAYVLSKADLVVSVDSGPMHIAAAVGVPLVAMFGPGDSKTWRPYSNNPERVVILFGACQCSPCTHYECPMGHHECMEGIKVDVVFSEAKRLLQMSGKIHPDV